MSKKPETRNQGNRKKGRDNFCKTLLWHLIVKDLVHFWTTDSSTLDETSVQKLKQFITNKYQNRVSQSYAIRGTEKRGVSIFMRPYSGT